MSEAREHLKKLLPHLKVLSLDADIDTLYEVKALIRDAEAFLAKNESEPVCYVTDKAIKRIKEKNYQTVVIVFSKDEVGAKQKLYAEPPTRKPLSDAEILDICSQHSFRRRDIIKTVEAAHGING